MDPCFVRRMFAGTSSGRSVPRSFLNHFHRSNDLFFIDTKISYLLRYSFIYLIQLTLYPRAVITFLL